MTSPTPLPLPARGPRSAERRQAVDDAVTAVLNLQAFRGWRLSSLRWSVVASLPAWIHTQWPLVPGPLQYLGCLVQGASLILAAGFAALEHVSSVRAEQRRADCTDVDLHLAWTARQQIRSALWYALAAVSALPWLALATGRTLPVAVPAAGLALGALTVLAGIAPRRRRSGRRAPRSDGTIPDGEYRWYQYLLHNQRARR